MIEKTTSIKNKYNKDLSLIIQMPEGHIEDIIIISHCFTCSKLYKLYNNISKFLLDKNYGLVRYDAMGLGDSGGDFSESSFTTNVEDLIAVHEYTSSNYKSPRFLFGHSLGSLVSMAAANLLDSVEGVSIVGSPLNFTRLKNLFSQYEDELRQKGSASITLSGRNINIGLSFLEDLKSNSSKQIIEDFNKSILVFHSNTDKLVPYQDGLDLFKSIKADKSFITLKDTSHLADRLEDAQYISGMLISWLANKSK